MFNSYIYIDSISIQLLRLGYWNWSTCPSLDVASCEWGGGGGGEYKGKFSWNNSVYLSVWIAYFSSENSQSFPLIAFFSPPFGFPDLIPPVLAARTVARYLSALFFFFFFFHCPPAKLFTTGRIMKYYRCRVLRKSLRNRALRNVIPGRVNGRREWSWIMIVELPLS